MFVLKAQFIAGSSTSQDMENSIDVHRKNINIKAAVVVDRTVGALVPGL